VTQGTPVAETIHPAAPLSSAPAPSTRRERLAEVARRAEASPAARALGTLRDIMVFATGNPDAEIMFVGEAPGAQEERLGAPFVGPAGNLLDRVLKAMGLERSAVYISNICKFRPKTDDDRQGTKNRKPTLTEMKACLEYVHEEIAIIQPRVLIALGATAAEGLLQRPITVNKVRGQWLECQGIPLMVTFHPSYLLHREADGEEAANTEKRKHWEDMLRVMEHLNMPVSEKQRAYFLPKSR
jgi:DNA polymerase